MLLVRIIWECFNYQLKIIERIEFLYSLLRFSFELSLKILPCLSSNAASQISILDLAHLRPSKCICLLTQKTHGLTAAKDIPVFVSEEVRKFYAALSWEQVRCISSLRSVEEQTLEQKKIFAPVFWVPAIWVLSHTLDKWLWSL